jgi:hypothetical protein
LAAYRVGGSTYFYFSSLFDSPTGLGLSKIAMDACTVTGAGRRAMLSCGQPITVGVSTQCVKIRIGPSRTGRFCSFVDKDFMAIDPARGRLYVAYTDFLIRLPFPSQVELAACDSATPPAAAGRRHPGRAGLQARHGPGPGEREVLPGKPYFVVAKPDPEAVSARAPTRPPGGVHRLRVQLVHRPIRAVQRGGHANRGCDDRDAAQLPATQGVCRLLRAQGQDV